MVAEVAGMVEAFPVEQGAFLELWMRPSSYETEQAGPVAEQYV
jgi:hypothetical protein